MTVQAPKPSLQRRRPQLLGLALLAPLLPAMAQPRELRLVVPDYPPFTMLENGIPAGSGVREVQKLLQAAGLRASIRVVPNYRRCLADVSAGRVDGFFLASENAERNAVGKLSLSVIPNLWVWLTPAKGRWQPQDPGFSQQARVGAVQSSNPHQWLIDNGYKITGTPPSPRLLLDMLDAGRFDAVLLPQQVFDYVLANSQYKREQYLIVPHLRVPFGIYLSHRLLAKEPELMVRINAAIEARDRQAATEPKR